jgi:hypothetical protein
VVKHSYDDIIITVGALVLGLGLLKFFEGPRYAYAAAPCASACAPFASSPGTYATCCKQHAATAAAAKPKVPARPAGFRTATLTPFQKANPLPVLKSRFPKPPSTHKLQNDQVKKVSDDTNSNDNVNTQKTKNPVQQLFDQVAVPVRLIMANNSKRSDVRLDVISNVVREAVPATRVHGFNSESIMTHQR